MSGWISVKDQLPERAGDYIVWIDGTSDTGDCTPGVRAPFFFFKQHGTFREDVTHWMPLPDAPEEIA
jgi:hypothetical protein